MDTILSKSQVYDHLQAQGYTVKSWAQAHGYTYQQVLEVTNGRNKATRGLGREIAIRLGMKRGTLNTPRYGIEPVGEPS